VKCIAYYYCKYCINNTVTWLVLQRNRTLIWLPIGKYKIFVLYAEGITVTASSNSHWERGKVRPLIYRDKSVMIKIHAVFVEKFRNVIIPFRVAMKHE